MVPDVLAEMSTSKVTVPTLGTVKVWALIPMYLRWSKTLKSVPGLKGTSLSVTAPEGSTCGTTPSRGP